ncbi:MAG: hypothetical protein RIQ96_860 [Pseudomonadota bacterium]
MMRFMACALAPLVVLVLPRVHGVATRIATGLLALAGMGLCGPAFAAGEATAAEGLQAARERIAQQRDEASRALERQRADCHQQFAVTDCIRRAEAAHRQQLGDLRRQEVALNRAERQAEAAAHQKRLDERAAAQAERASKASAAQSQPVPPPTALSGAPVNAGVSEEEIEVRRKQEQARRDQQARERAERARQADLREQQRAAQRQERDKRDAERKQAAQKEAPPRAPAASLPVPP